MRFTQRQRKLTLFCAVALGLLLILTPVRAHAVLSRANPPANTALEAAPAEIRLWFTEPLEPQFSQIILRDARGNPLSMPPAQVDSADPMQMFLLIPPGSLTEGLYTVSWRVVSTADGHPTQGAFAFAIGAAVTFNSVAVIEEPIPVDSAAIRWLNFVALALMLGSLGFFLFVWSPAVSGTNTVTERRMQLLTWAGWLALGAAGVLALLLQASVANGIPLLNALDGSLLSRIISGTRYGNLWLIRMALWLGFGVSLLFARGDRWFYWIAVALGAGLVLTYSLYSHASGMPNPVATVAADWIHLLSSTLWIGGLVQIVNILSAGRRNDVLLATPEVSAVVGYFSNFARVCVGILILTGLYASWLHVGSVEGLLTTQYGQALLVKLILFLPLLGLAATNLIVTQRRLQAGEVIWVGRLRGLVSAEVALTILVLAAVGAMTAIQPARSALATRAAAPPSPNPIVEEQTADDLRIGLEITPGWVGSNTFNVKLTGADGSPVTDASLIRLRFTSGSLGESELRPEHIGDGVYSIIGENLSVAGDWRIRTSIQRPNKFDTLVDFNPSVGLPPAPPPPPDPVPPLPSRIYALLLTGVAALGVGAFFAAQNRLSLRTGAGLLTSALLIVGVIFLGSGLIEMRSRPVSAAMIENASAKLAVREGLPLPYVITLDGVLMQPQADGTWADISPKAAVNDIYLSANNRIFAATSGGLQLYDGVSWRSLDETPLDHVDSMHGYLFALGDHAVLRFHELPGGEIERTSRRPLLESEQRIGEMVMLGDHSHVLLVGGQLFSTPDLGLSWEALDNLEPAQMIGTDADGKLLAVTDTGVLRRDNEGWRSVMPLPENTTISSLRVFNDQLYALAGGRLYRQAGASWERVIPPGSENVALSAMAVQYPQTLWLVDANSTQVWSSTDAEIWTVTPVQA